MEFFLDSAYHEEIHQAIELWDVDGITTNPEDLQAANKPFMTTMREMADLIKGTDRTVSVQTNPHNHANFEAIIAEAEVLASISPNFVIKIPCTAHGFKACELLSEEGIRVNMTLCFSAFQALQAMRRGAYFISPYIDWKDNAGTEMHSLVPEIISIKNQYQFDTEILVTEIQNVRHITEAALAGADIVTASFQIYEEAFNHPLTESRLARLKELWDRTPYSADE